MATSAMLEDGFASIARVVEQATADKKVAAFLLIASDVPKWIEDGRIPWGLARDRMFQILRENDVPSEAAWQAADKIAKPEAKVISLPGLEPQADKDWRTNLVRDGQGMLKPRVSINFLWMLAKHQEMEGVFAFNEMAHEVWVVKRPPWARSDWRPAPLHDNDITCSIHWLEKRLMTPGPLQVFSQINELARWNTYNPVRDYFNSLVWDGVDRLATFPEEFFGSPVNPIYGVFFAKWLVSAVARIMQPGCKVDCIIVLEGDQARMKSTFLRMMAQINGVNYFNDDLHDIESKDSTIQMQGILILEVAELHAFQRKDADAIKSWLSRQTDRYRPVYGRLAIEVPRKWVIAGTLNPAGSGYLRDPTGARRFWPIPVRQPIDIKRVEEIRDQLWAEAVHLYRSGYQWHLTEDEMIQASEVTEERYEDDPWDGLIDEFIRGRDRFTIQDIIRGLNIPIAQQTQLTSRRIGRHLRHRGWEKRRARLGHELDYVWTRRET